MLSLKVDSETKSIKIEMMLKGETKSLEVEIKKYQIIKDMDKVFIEIEELETNREWLNIVIDTYLHNKKIEVPQKFVPLLDIAL
jgi:hypothetical protein